MAYKMFAAIYVGSSEISMKIFQVNGRKTFRQIDSVSRILELGRDTYREGKLSRESIKMICEELEGLKHGSGAGCDRAYHRYPCTGSE